MNAIKNNRIQSRLYGNMKGNCLVSTLRTSFANVACVALLAGIMTACADDSTAIDNAVNEGRILAAQVAGVSIQGAGTNETATTVATRAATIPQPNKVITDFEVGDVFFFNYNNSLEGGVKAYVKKQADGSWNRHYPSYGLSRCDRRGKSSL